MHAFAMSSSANNLADWFNYIVNIVIVYDAFTINIENCVMHDE